MIYDHKNTPKLNLNHSSSGKKLDSELERKSEESTYGLVNSLAFNEKVISCFKIGILIYNSEGKCVSTNEEALRMMSEVNKDNSSRDFMNLASLKYCELYKNAMKTLETGEENELTINFQVDEENTIWFCCRFVKIILNQEPHLLLIGNDITNNKMNEILLRDAKEQSDKVDKMKSEFIANMSHEIRNPLNAVIGFSEILYSEMNEMKHKNYVRSINNAGKALLNIMNDILDLSELETGMMALKSSEMSPEIIIDEADRNVSEVTKSELKNRLVPILNDLKFGIKGDTTNELIKILVDLAHEFGINYFVVMGRLIKEAIECFDVIKVNEYLIQLNKWLTFVSQEGDG